MNSFTEVMEALKVGKKQDETLKESMFIVMSANKWVEQAKLRPTPRKLFSEFWYEGELCILFADTNQGKSILAVQIGDSISKGLAVCGFTLESPRQKVLYCDFELSDKQFEARYSEEFKSHYRFDEFFIRAEINIEGNGDNVEERISQELETIVTNCEAKILIIDNLTYLRSDTEKAKDALPLMKQLKALKKKHGLSIMCLAHTPKRDLSKPITRNDLQGSKMLINFCDSSFAIGESNKDKSVRYLKQVKARNTEVRYDSENIILCEINKRQSFLGFEFICYGDERDHLKVFATSDKENRIAQALELKQKGFNNIEIAGQLGVSEGAVRKWLKKADAKPLEPSVPLVQKTDISDSNNTVAGNEGCPF